ncbi:glycosyltransferase [Chloroflexota bacterium]
MAAKNNREAALSLWIIFQIGLLVFLLFPLSIALWNTRALKGLGDYTFLPRFPRVSLLVPVRNEEDNIGPCLRSLLKQTYPDFKVIALDDNSTDDTWSVLEELAKKDQRLTVVKGDPLPDGWLGKHWACHQLFQLADGELVVFTDADTHHEPDTMNCAVAALLAENADLVTAFPKQRVLSWAERLAVPVVPWSIFSFLPLALSHRLKTPRISFGSGAYMLFTRASYEMIGGHSSVRDNIVDDLALAKRIKSINLRLRILDGTKHVSCRMYKDFHQVIDGFGKNLFAAFDNNIPLFMFIWLWIGLVFIEPPIFILYGLLGSGVNAFSMLLAGGTIVLSIILWGLTYQRFKFRIWLAGLYPITVVFFIVIAIRSMILTLTGKTSWKDRDIRSSG